MKKINLLLIFLFFFSFTFSQEESLDYIVLKTSINDTENVLTNNTISKLLSRITQIATNYGFSAIEKNHDFVISIDFHLYENNIVTGLKKTNTINGEIFFTIYNSSSKIQYSSYSYPIIGSGNNQNLAIANAIKKIRTSTNGFKDFFSKAKLKIYDFYKSNCKNIIASSKNHLSQQQYAKVLVDLSSVPMGVNNCKKQSKELIKKAYLKLQNKTCRKIFLKGKSEIANNNFTDALQTLSYIDPESNCYRDALKAIQNIENEIDKKDLRKWKLLLDLNKNKANLEAHRLEVIKEIGVAYYTDQIQKNQNILDLIIIK